jgi:signal transduction histidine kinase
MTATYKVSGALGGTHSVDDILEVILDESIRVLGADGIAFFVRSDPSEPLRLGGVLGREPRWLPLTDRAAMKEIAPDSGSAVGLAARTGEVVVFESSEQLRKRFPQRFAEVRGPLPEAVIVAPMVVHGHTLGVLVIGWAKRRRISEDDRAWTRGVAQDCAFAIERTRLFEAERRARIRAEDATRAQESFFSSVSHELRAPMMSILAWVHTLEKGRLDRAQYRRALQAIESSARAQTRLVDDVIAMSRAPSHRPRVDVRSAQLAPLVRSWLEDMHGPATAKEISLEEGPNAKVAVAVDVGRLRLAMHKILTDAIDASPKGGRVSVTSEEHGGRVCIRVRREGAASSDGAHEAPSPSSRPAGNGAADTEKHLGLNLAIANVVVRQHGGTLTVGPSGPDRSPTVTLDLPALDPMAGLLAASSPADTGATVPLAGTRILLVDDDGDAREALGEMLAADGAEVRSEPSTKAGLAALTEFSPTVIVSAVGTSDEDSYGFIRAVRAMPSPVASVPALTLSSRNEDADAAINAGFQRRLSKPPNPGELSDTIAQMHASSGPR